jgi:hypothetical protein
MHNEIKSLSTETRDLRKFGLLVGGVFLVLGGLALWRHKSIALWLLTPGAILFVLGLVFPRSLKLVYVGWMTMAFALGLVVSSILLTIFYYVVVTPIGLTARLAGKDFLSLKLDPKAQTYWLPREKAVHTAADYEQQF